MRYFPFSWLTRINVAVVLSLAMIGSRAQAELFVVAEIPGSEHHSDSYVVPIDAPVDIAYARRLIDEGPSIGQTIVVAAIAAGADDINRDYLAESWPNWSWHVTEFKTFADMTMEILDAWPTYVESDVDEWIRITDGLVGFWSYTVVAELRPADFNADGNVDGEDLFVWQRGFGHSGGAGRADGDADADNGVDGNDFLIWQREYKSGVGNVGSRGNVLAIPEPASVVLSLLLLGMTMARSWPSIW